MCEGRLTRAVLLLSSTKSMPFPSTFGECEEIENMIKDIDLYLLVHRPNSGNRVRCQRRHCYQPRYHLAISFAYQIVRHLKRSWLGHAFFRLNNPTSGTGECRDIQPFYYKRKQILVSPKQLHQKNIDK